MKIDVYPIVTTRPTVGESMVNDSKNEAALGYEFHVFICSHERPPEATRPCCSAKESLQVMKRLKMAAKEEGFPNVRVQKSGCLNFCENGISCVVYPEGIWYSIQNPDEDIPAIIEHLRTGIPADSCRMKLEE